MNVKKMYRSLAWLTLIAVLLSIFGAAPGKAADPTTIASSTLVFEGTLTDEGGGVYSGVLAMVDGAGETAAGLGDGVGGYDVWARNGATAWFGDDPGSDPVWTSVAVASHDAWSGWDPDTPDWYQYSLKLYEDGGEYKWAVRNHPGATSGDPWSSDPASYPPKGVPMSGEMDWTDMYAFESDVGAYLTGTGTPEIPGGAATKGGGAGYWDMDWSWGSEAVPLAHGGFDVDIDDLGGDQYRVTLTPQEPAWDTPGAWIIYPPSDGRPDHWAGNDRTSVRSTSNWDTSIDHALGYAPGDLVCNDGATGPACTKSCQQACEALSYNPPPADSIIELRGPGAWDIYGTSDDCGFSCAWGKLMGITIVQDDVTIRGQDHSGQQQDVFLHQGSATTPLFWVEAEDVTIENLHVRGEWPTYLGGYVFTTAERYGYPAFMLGTDPHATGLTVEGCTLNNVRAPFDAGLTWESLTFTENTVTDVYYNVFKKYGATFAGDNLIVGNTFNHVGEGKSYPLLDIVDNSGTTCIDNNTFNGWKSGEYAIEGNSSGLSAPISLGPNNTFVDQTGGSGAGYKLYPLSTGHAVGAKSSGDISEVGGCTPPSEVWVDDDYCDTCGNDGHTWGYDAFDVIQDGIDAVEGSIVHVGPGTYNENVLIPSSKAGLQLLGAGKTNTHLVITSGSAIETHAPVTIRGFHIQGPSRGTGTAVQIRSDGSGCPSSASGTAASPGVIEENKADSLNYGVQLHDHCNEYWEIKNNEFDDLRIGVGLQNSRHFVVSGNTFDDYKEGVSMGWGNDTAYDVAITNNEFLKDGDAGDDLAAIVLSSATHDVTVRGNDIHNSDIGVLVKNRDGANTPDLSNTSVSCNNISGNTDGIVNEHADAMLIAEDNWWGDASGPYDPNGTSEVPPCTGDPASESNTDGAGDPVSDDVDYCPWLGASARTVSIDVPDEVGEDVTDLVVQVDINCVADFDAAQFDVTYDPAVLEIIGTEGGAGVTDGDIGGTTIPVALWGFVPGGTSGTARVIVNVPDAPGVSGSGYLAEIHFKVLGTECTNSNITLSNGLLSDKDAQEIPANWVGDSFHVNSALDADFSADSGISGHSQEGYAGVTSFVFSDLSTGGTPCGTPPYAYEWDFDNDGSVDSTAQNPTHVYGTAGTYTVKLTVTDCLPGGGTSDTKTKTDYITVYDPLVPGCSVTPSEGTANCTTFTFSDASSGGKPGYTYEWEFGDGGTGSGTPATHIYATTPACSPGPYPTYTASLKVTDALGTEKTATCTTDVYKPGDANQDCAVNIFDVTKVERMILGLDAATPGADANCDGNVNVLDVTKIELIIMAAP
jgi:PKD repeat protein